VLGSGLFSDKEIFEVVKTDYFIQYNYGLMKLSQQSCGELDPERLNSGLSSEQNVGIDKVEARNYEDSVCKK